MTYFCKGKYRLLLVIGLGFLCFILFSFTIINGNAHLRLFAYPKNYVPTMSSTPGILISAEYYPGKVDKVRYTTAYGSFLTWNSTSGNIGECGQYVESPYDSKIYWTPSGENTMSKVTNKISIKVGILDKDNNLLAEKEVNIFYDGFYTVQESPDVVIGVKGHN